MFKGIQLTHSEAPKRVSASDFSIDPTFRGSIVDPLWFRRIPGNPRNNIGDLTGTLDVPYFRPYEVFMHSLRSERSYMYTRWNKCSLKKSNKYVKIKAGNILSGIGFKEQFVLYVINENFNV